jgi:aspartate aminotransferase-like enzyme
MPKLLLIPGPSPVDPRILRSLAEPTVSHVGPEMVEDMRAALEDLKKIVFCAAGQPFIIAGAGTLAMEIALLNLAGPAGRVLVLSQGYFGDRMAQICASFGIAYDLIASPWGSGVRAEELAERIAARAYDIVVATHVDTGTGSCAPVEEYAEVLKGRGILYVVDGVCATGGIEERMDDWGIDVVLTAAQKCFGAPPGLAIDVFSERALARRRSLPAVLFRHPSLAAGHAGSVEVFLDALRQRDPLLPRKHEDHARGGDGRPLRAPPDECPGRAGRPASPGLRAIHPAGVSGGYAFGGHIPGRRGGQGLPDALLRERGRGRGRPG